MAKWKVDLSHMKTKLHPLTSVEKSLSDLVSGSAVSRSRSKFVGTGWFYRVTRLRAAADNDTGRAQETRQSAAEALSRVQDHITELWKHPAVEKLVKLRKIDPRKSAVR